MNLDDVRILDLTMLLPGPFATQHLVDMGAEVIRVEHPDGRDYVREGDDFVPEAGNGMSTLFNMVNRGKKSVTLDLKDDADRDRFFDLVETADAVIEAFRPGVVDRLGVGYEAVSAANPEIVYCSLTGYGQSGPYSDRVGHDLNYAGFAGILDLNRRDEEDRPVPIPYPIGDTVSGLYAAFSIVSALFSARLDSGDGGTYLDVSMTDSLLSLAGPCAAIAMSDDEEIRPGSHLITGKYPSYDIYETADGRYVTLCCLEPEFWKNFCEAVDRPDLIDEHRSEDAVVRQALRDELDAVFASRPLDEWEERLGDRDVMFGLVKRLDEVFDDRQVGRRMYVDEAGEPRLGFPVQIDGDFEVTTAEPPRLGEHNEEVFGDVEERS